LTAAGSYSEHSAVTLSFLYRAFCRALQLIRLIYRGDTDLAVEVVMLRHEVAVLQRQVYRPALEPADRAVLSGLARMLPRRRLGRFFVQPATLLRWHRDLVAEHWTNSRSRPGRPGIPTGTTTLVLRLAKENPDWGYRRIHGELATIGIVIAPSSVWAMLKRHGIDPSPRRSGPTWAEFLAAQAKGLMACDFFHVDTVFLRRLYVLVFIHHDTRRVRIAGVTANPVAAWVTQQARNLSMELADEASAVKFLIRDRDTKFTTSFDAVFAGDGVRIVKSPIRAPKTNAICERVIGGIRRECLDRMLILGRRHLEAVLTEYVDHYNSHRPHRSLGQRSPSALNATPAPIDDIDPATLRRTDRLGGLIHEYRMAA
jgi:transposase InsO family protein